MSYRKLVAATCRSCGQLVPAGSLKRDLHTWSGRQYRCRDCSRAADKRRYADAKTKPWHRWQRGANAAPHRRYRRAHRRIVAARGPASAQTCYCGAPGDEWALLPMVPRIADGPYTYSPDPDDYVAMCRSHHRIWDNLFNRLDHR